jgi:hypothetical protein
LMAPIMIISTIEMSSSGPDADPAGKRGAFHVRIRRGGWTAATAGREAPVLPVTPSASRTTRSSAT